MPTYFPLIALPPGQTAIKQVSKVLSEFDEVTRALRDNEPPERVYEELADVLQSLETLIEVAPFEMRAAIKRVITKNSERGYYGTGGVCRDVGNLARKQGDSAAADN